jgi:hypothetical protein
MTDVLSGVGAAVPTLRGSNGAVDKGATGALVELLRAQGCSMVLVAGTTGRGAVTSVEDRVALAGASAALPVVCGVRSAVEEVELAQLAAVGADAVLVAFQEGAHVREVFELGARAERHGLVMVAYHHPSVHNPMPREWWPALAAAGVPVKNSDPAVEVLTGMLASGCSVLVGSTKRLGDTERASGVMSGLASVRFDEVWRASIGDEAALEELVALEGSVTDRLSWIESEARRLIA